MASILRHIVASNRVKHNDTGLDLCYVTSNLIATSGPSQTYPRAAYRNPLDRLVSFLDAKHGDNWAIWEFRAEGTGYPDEAVYNRIRHYPWPDHHPPPFNLVPMIVASMRNWLAGGELDITTGGKQITEEDKSKRVVVVHCKAGKGRSGTMACSYLIAECGWTAEDALVRFTERRMRPGYGAGVSIPSQLRWVGYVDRWAKHGKKYVDLPIEIVEIHVWGLRHGVKVSVEGYENEGKKIKVFHTFRHDERIVVEGDAPGGKGVMDLVTDMAGYVINNSSASSLGSEAADDTDYGEIAEGVLGGRGKAKTIAIPEASQTPPSLGSSSTQPPPPSLPPSQSTSSLQKPISFADESEPGGQAVIFKPHAPILIPNSDVNIVVERRNRVRASKMLTMVTSIAHVWFNTYFEGYGPEQEGQPDDSGLFEIDWDQLDGIKGSTQRGTRACDRFSVVWRVAGTSGAGTTTVATKEGESSGGGVVVFQPGEDSPVPQMEPADWKGQDDSGGPTAEKNLGLRVADPESASISKASSLTEEVKDDGDGSAKDDKDKVDDDDGAIMAGVKVSGPAGEEVLDAGTGTGSGSGNKDEDRGKEVILES
ncbi:protein-tyrosine phosphatase-like protein [Apodospora peruviana]|uniref:phosphatidylinositol-3,4,5-trisphosphate 3-phosphatase n=1 Tax=Apodospora peruviana TaxID=516989 RepID=A0AAE0I4B7_9PEZI|nr:protein-tyrosine phosphatase-like protein [Apodospora peruviana]